MQFVFSGTAEMHTFLHPFWSSHPSPRGSAPQFKNIEMNASFYGCSLKKKKKGKKKPVLVAWDLTFHPSVRGNVLICKIKHVSVFVMCLKGTCIKCFSQRGSPAKSGRKTCFVWTYSSAITPHDSLRQLPFLLNCLALLSITGFSFGHLCLALGEFILIIIYESSLLYFTVIVSKTNHLHSHNLKPLSLMLIFHSVFV